MYTGFLSYIDIHCWKYYNGLILLQWFLNMTHFYHFHVVWLIVLPSNFIISGVKS